MLDLGWDASLLAVEGLIVRVQVGKTAARGGVTSSGDKQFDLDLYFDPVTLFKISYNKTGRRVSMFYNCVAPTIENEDDSKTDI